ncbi:kinase-like protein [Durotheca rogersii]|uniref:kinase-like protein n=1 Tax=Durotheca rogersii TaxID=419775 RepID=UPI00221FC1D4|nr:kinase-like protein [Durotheca rogersii]KAI5865406.1 kinase-like protein [Durotheca rogersii]
MTSGQSHPQSQYLPEGLLAVDRNRQPKSKTHPIYAPFAQEPQALTVADALNRRNAQANHVAQLYGGSSNGTNYICEEPEPSIPTAPAPIVSSGQIQFQSHTTAPSPPLPQRESQGPSSVGDDAAYSPSPSRRGDNPLHIATDVPPTLPARSDSLNSNPSSFPTFRSGLPLQNKTSSPSLKPVSRTPSLKQHLSRGIGSAASSTYPSPVISAMGDVTPLPSPLLGGDSPGPWKRLNPRRSSQTRDIMAPPVPPESVLITTSGESVASALANQSKRKVYAGLNVSHALETSSGKVEHTRNRSISEYIPDPKGIPKRQHTVSGKVDGKEVDGTLDPHLRREPHLSESRGIRPVSKPPTPPPSESSQSSDGSSSKRPRIEYFEAHGRHDQRLRRWRAVKELGQGTFSRVMLATSQVAAGDGENQNAVGNGPSAPASPDANPHPDRKTLVAVKICEHGPRGGASEERIEMSLKRELDIMQSISHPSLVHLKAWNIEPSRALLVLSYCPGGDLFDVATTYRDALTPPLLRRIFAELVGAVGYLHERRIVHRDIKLENVLVNIPPAELAKPDQDWTVYPYSVITLTDLGLSRRVADDEKLETRCGSDDYAAPEVILGQPYDGRAVDAWSLGVLLYALIESRLPFDPPPGASDVQRMRSRTSHRIARVEWRWIKYQGDDGDHDASEAKFEHDGLKGAMEITEGLLKRARSRWPMEKVAEHEWVSGGIEVEGGIKFREEEEGEEVF